MPQASVWFFPDLRSLVQVSGGPPTYLPTYLPGTPCGGLHNTAYLPTFTLTRPLGSRNLATCLRPPCASSGWRVKASPALSARTTPDPACTFLDGLRCRRGGRQGVFEGQTSDGDEPGDPSPLPRLPCSSLNRFVSGPHGQPEHAIWSVLSEITIFLSDL